VDIPTILRKQLGFALKMIGAKNIVTFTNGIQFKIGRNPKGITHIKIILTPDDLYDMTFTKCRRIPKTGGYSIKDIANLEGVYWGDLGKMIEETTGLYTSL
jgi:hypothetical protein